MDYGFLWIAVPAGICIGVPLLRQLAALWRGDTITKLDRMVKREIEREMR